MELVRAPCERPRDTKVPKARLTILSNQDIVLDTLSIGAQVHSIVRFAYRTDTTV